MRGEENNKMFEKYLKSVVNGERLAKTEAYHAAKMLLHDNIPELKAAAFLSALRTRRETAEELSGFVEALLDEAIILEADANLLDTCGTGGDNLSTFNISTTTALVVASCDVKVAKHGNRAVTGKVGSADILEALGVNITMSPDLARKMLDEVGITFLFAPYYHPILKEIGPIRRNIGIPTIFNFLGPIVNPLNPDYQVMGIADSSLQATIAKTLQNIGRKRAMVVNAENGMDEISLIGKTKVYEINNSSISKYHIDPLALGFNYYSLDGIKGGELETNIRITLGVLNGNPGAPRDVVVLNSAAALLVSRKVSNLVDGIRLAEEAIDTGKAKNILTRMISYSRDEVLV